MARAAASFMAGVMRRAPASRAPRKMPGNARTLLIWLGKSLRPVATTAAYLEATSGSTSGSGLDRAKTIALWFISFRCSSSSREEETPMNTSAPRSASPGPPTTPRGLLRAASWAFLLAVSAAMSARSRLITPRESSSTTSSMPAVSRISATAIPAAPAPDTTTRSPSGSREVTFAAPVRAARTTTAVPCWSSCMTGQSRASISFSSSSKQRGAETSSRLTAPKLGRRRTRVSTISSTSVVLRTSGMESRSPNALKRADLPSITGSEALAPGVGLRQLRVGGDGAADLGDAGRVGDGEIAFAGQRDGAGDRELAALVGGEDFLVAERCYRGVCGPVGGGGIGGNDRFNGHVVVSWGSPWAYGTWLLGHSGARDGLGELRGAAPGWRACDEAPGSAGAGAAPVLPW